MEKYTERQTVMISKVQKESLETLRSYNVNVSQFIRRAIKEKLQRDWRSIKEKKNKDYCPFLKSNKMVRYIVPYTLDKDLGKFYNKEMEALPNDDDWCVFVDGDAMFATHFFGNQIEEIINKEGVELFTSVTNRVGNKHQCIDGMWDEDRMSKLWEKGKELADKYGSELVDITDYTPLSGVLIGLKKGAWKRIGGFKSEPGLMLSIDNSIHDSMRKDGGKVWMAKGLFLIHYYRNGIKKNKQHLL